MNPDLKHLCEAAAEQFDSLSIGIQDADGNAIISYVAGWQMESIVRAVLTALREPSEGMSRAMHEAMTQPRMRFADDTGEEFDNAAEGFTAMIDHILNR